MSTIKRTPWTRQAPFGTQLNRGSPQTRALLAWYPFNDTASSLARDWSLINNHGTVTGTTIVAGSSGIARSFNGSSDFVTTPNHALGTSHAVSFWLNPGAITDSGVVGGRDLGAGQVDYAAYLDGVSAGSSIYYRANYNSVSPINYVSVLHGGFSGWTHFFILRYGASVQFFKNGVQIGATQTLAADQSILTQFIGKLQGSSFLVGKLQDVRFYSDAIIAGPLLPEIYGRPYDLFEPISKKIYWDVGAGSGNQTITVPLATITVAANAPTVTQSGNQTVTIPSAGITVAANAPTVNRTQSVTVPAAAIAVNALAPTVNRTQSITVPAAAITVATNAPTVSQQSNTPISVPAAAITVAANAPTVNRTQSISVPVSEIVVNAYAPTLGQTGVLPAEVLAELYGGNIISKRLADRKKKKKKEEKPSIDEMVFQISKSPEGKKEIIKALPKPIQEELPDPQLALVSDLINKIEDASARVQKKVEQIYRKRIDDDDEDDVFILLL